MTKRELVDFFKIQLETADENYRIAFLTNNREDMIHYQAYVQAYREALYKVEHLDKIF